MKWFADHVITVLNWPANSPHILPTETVWSTVKRNFYIKKKNITQWKNTDDLYLGFTLFSSFSLLTPCHPTLIQLMQFMVKELQPSTECVNERAFQKLDIAVLKILD